MENKKNRFIVIEGIDGAGKDTQAELLHKKLENSYLGYAPTRVGGLQKIIRKNLKENTLDSMEKQEILLSHLMYTDRLIQTYNLENGINTILETKDYISVRYSLSFEVYNSISLNTSIFMQPDILIFLDLTPEESLDRIRKRSSEMEDIETERYENYEKLESTRKKYLTALRTVPRDTKVIIINASGSIEEIHNLIMAGVK